MQEACSCKHFKHPEAFWSTHLCTACYYSIQDLLNDFKVKDFTELTLGGNAPLVSVGRLKWNSEGIVWVFLDTLEYILHTPKYTYLHTHIQTYIHVCAYMNKTTHSSILMCILCILVCWITHIFNDRFSSQWWCISHPHDDISTFHKCHSCTDGHTNFQYLH